MVNVMLISLYRISFSPSVYAYEQGREEKYRELHGLFPLLQIVGLRVEREIVEIIILISILIYCW